MSQLRNGDVRIASFQLLIPRKGASNLGRKGQCIEAFVNIYMKWHEEGRESACLHDQVDCLRGKLAEKDEE